MTVSESIKRNISLGWTPILYNTVSFIIAAIKAACYANLRMVNNVFFNGVSLDFANMNMLVTLLLLTDLKEAVATHANDEACAKT